MCGLYCHLFFVVLLLVLGERIAGRLGWNVCHSVPMRPKAGSANRPGTHCFEVDF